MISVAMATYNGEKYIKAQLDSILSQTVSVEEIVIVDDCSTDQTVEIIQKYIKENKAQSLIKLLTKAENEGYVKNFFRAMENTSGEYVFLADQDDIWYEDKVEKMLEVMKENVKIKLLASQYDLINETGEITKKNKGRDKTTKISFDYLMFFNIAPGCTYLVKREIIDLLLNQGDLIMQLPHDWQLSILAASKSGLYLYNPTKIQYRLHGNNTLGLSRAKNVSDRIIDLEKHLKEQELLLELLINKKIINKNLKQKNLYALKITSSRIKLLELKSLDVVKYLKLLNNGFLAKNLFYDYFLVFKNKLGL